MTIKVKAIIFDMDGVITNTMPDHYRVWRQVFAREGIAVSSPQIYQREGQRGITSIIEIFKEHQKDISIAKARLILARKERMFKKIVKRRFIRGSRTFIKDVLRKGFRLALVTGTSRHELDELLPKSIQERFEVIVTGSDVKNGKPHPEPFQQALRRLKLMAKYAVVIENAPFGVESAQKAGLRCLAVETSLPKIYLKKASSVFKSIKDLRARVQLSHSGTAKN